MSFLDNIKVEPEEQAEQEQESKDIQQEGRDLAALIHHKGWEVAIGILEKIVSETEESYWRIKPGENSIPLLHAETYAYKRMLARFKERIAVRLESLEEKKVILTSNIFDNE